MASARQKHIRTNDPANTRARALDAAVDLFHRQGYAETSMQDILQAAGVTSGALHHHYATKKALGLAVIRDRVAAMVEQAWITPLLSASSARDGVSRAFGDIINGLDETSIIGCPLNNLALELAYIDPDFRFEIQQVFDKWHKALSRRIGAGMPASDVPGMNADELATMIIACYSGAMTMAKTAQSANPLTVVLKLLTRLLGEARVPD